MPITLPAWVITFNRVGSGREAVRGREVTVHYTRWLYDPRAADNRGRELDSSRTDDRPLTFQLGTGDFTLACEEGIAGMQVGGRCVVVVAGAAADAARPAHGPVPHHVPVVYEIELLNVT